MLKNNSLINRRSYRQLTYPLISLFLATGLTISSASPSLAFPWRQIILQGIQVIQLTTLSDNQEVQLGKQINAQLVSKEIKLHQNQATQRYINGIGQRLAQASARPDIPYTFQVVEDDSINAFATMGGYVYVNTGLIKAADNEAELASVIAHEIGHIAGRHAVKQMRQMAIASGVATATGLDENVAVQIGVELALRRPKSREAENEADYLGIQTLGKAGYAQIGAITFMEKLLSKGSMPSFLSTHPATSSRISTMRQFLAANPNVGDGLNETAYKTQVNRML
jgi:predicted Zn-dependent protease